MLEPQGATTSGVHVRSDGYFSEEWLRRFKSRAYIFPDARTGDEPGDHRGGQPTEHLGCLVARKHCVNANRVSERALLLSNESVSSAMHSHTSGG
jgi:hypothetical protein